MTEADALLSLLAEQRAEVVALRREVTRLRGLVDVRPVAETSARAGDRPEQQP